MSARPESRRLDPSAADPMVDQSDQLTDVNYLELTFALAGGIVAWLLRLIANVALVPYSCQLGSSWPLWVSTGVAALVTVAALMSSVRFWRRKDEGDDASHVGTAGWLGLLAVVFNIMSLSGIIFESVPILFIDVCLTVY
jgi:hypothetical protein